MAELPNLFDNFLGEIRPTKANRRDYIEGHKTLRRKLQDSDSLNGIYVADFLQGSYQRSTALRPVEGKRSDVDIVFVTNLLKEDYPDPEKALKECIPFLENNYQSDKWEMNNRSFEIQRENVDLDLVLTAAPSEATENELTADGSVSKLSVEESLDTEMFGNALENMGYEVGTESDDWRVDPLDIPNCDENCWDQTHPLYVSAWTTEKNKETDGHYVNVVKAIKWWKRTQIDEPERPKGYPLEHIVGTCCPNDIDSVAEGITRTLERFTRKYRRDAREETTPVMRDRALPSQNVLARLDGEDFANFYEQAAEAGQKAREAFGEDDPNAARDKWTSILGNEFPEYGHSSDENNSGEDDDDGGWETGTNGKTNVRTERYA